MTKSILIRNATIVNENTTFKGDVLIENEIIKMKIVYEGFYGYKNAGDDAFIEVSSWGAEKYWNCKNHKEPIVFL